jgi:thiazole synthase ThiGH ThiG subunit
MADAFFMAVTAAEKAIRAVPPSAIGKASPTSPMEIF